MPYLKAHGIKDGQNTSHYWCSINFPLRQTTKSWDFNMIIYWGWEIMPLLKWADAYSVKVYAGDSWSDFTHFGGPMVGILTKMFLKSQMPHICPSSLSGLT